jgi:hypothetical protein
MPYLNCQVNNLALSDSKGTHQFKIPVINGVIDNCLSSLEVDNPKKIMKQKRLFMR